MPRKKPIAPRIGSQAEAGAVMTRLAEIARKRADIDTEMNREIDQAKAEAKREAEPLIAEEKQLGEQLAAYATYQKDQLFKDGKTMKLAHGKFGFRKTSSLKPMPKFKLGDVLEALKDRGGEFLAGIRTKEEVNKDVLREWSDTKLAEVHARVVSQDEFFYEVDTESLPG